MKKNNISKAMPGVVSRSYAHQTTKAMPGVVSRSYAHQTTKAMSGVVSRSYAQQTTKAMPGVVSRSYAQPATTASAGRQTTKAMPGSRLWRDKSMPGALSKNYAHRAAKLLREGTIYLQKKKISEPKLNCEWILAKALNMERLALLINPDTLVNKADTDKFKKLMALKAERAPLSYIFKEHNFMGFSLFLNRSALIPRPETEELVELVLTRARKIKKNKIKILDFGTGSGCIALALAKSLKNCKLTAVDKSKRALKCAEKNIKKFQQEKKIKLFCASKVSELSGKFDLIVSNPPYIPSTVIGNLDEEVQFEPKMALDGGMDGLKIVKEIIKEAPKILLKGGRVFLEIEENQSGILPSLINKEIWSEIVFHKDYNNKQRFLELVLK
ncbi:MAG: peptide chain release factor N(5)-glutamine methyltransferase [Elusimicrobia bacterium]|nr:peptide chain release factor N(5)-glutamine methyltransferase [Elusimicrobiota bacterium]